MRVVHVIQELRTGGAERVVVSLCAELARRGHEVAVIAGPGELHAELAGHLSRPAYDIPVLGRQPARLPLAARRMRRAMLDFAPDVIHAHNPGMALLVALSGRTRTPGLVSIHGVPDADWRVGSRLLRMSRMPIVACGPGVAEALRLARAPAIETIPNGVPPAPEPADRAALMREWGMPEDTRIVLTLGRLVEQKNQQLVIRALALLPDDVRLVLVGEGADQGMLEALAADLDVTKRVVFAGRRPGRPLLAIADVVCMPSLWEGMPLVGVETMMAGRPLVVTDVRGSRELVDNDRTGLTVPANDPLALATALERVLSDDGLGLKLAAEAKLGAAGMTEAAMVDGYLDLYSRLV